MSLTIHSMRPAHCKGHTDICFTDNGRHMITGGNKGDIRIWNGIDDDKAEFHSVGEKVFSVVQKKDYIYVSIDNGQILILKYPNCERQGLLVQVAAPVTHMVVAKDKDILACVSDDLSVKILNLPQGTIRSVFKEFSGPELSLAISNDGRLLAVTSGDVVMYIYNVEDKKLKKKICCVRCTSRFGSTKQFCRPSFDPKSKFFAYPFCKKVIIHDTIMFNKVCVLKNDNINILSIIKFSYCGKYISGSSIKGEVCVWDRESEKYISHTQTHQKENICAMQWHPKVNGEIIFSDTSGHIGVVEVSNSTNLTTSETESDSPEKAKTAPVNIQQPFQSGSTPVHLKQRFLAYNEVGTLQARNGEDPRIYFKFHDVNVARNGYVRNRLNLTMGSLSSKIIALACKTPGMLKCISTEVSNKCLSIEMSDLEEILCITASINLVAVATDTRFLKVFSIYGPQMAILPIPGPVVALSSYKNDILAVFHASTSDSEQQNLSSMLIKFKDFNINSKTLPIPVTRGATLIWLGFTDQGSIVTYDSSGILRQYHMKNNFWFTIFDANIHAKSASDTYFITSVSETSKIVYAIHCKGAIYPQTTPRPTLTELPMQSV